MTHSPSRPAGLPLGLDLVERGIIAVAFGFMCWPFLHSWLDTGSLISLVLLLTEASVVVFVLIRRFARDVSQKPFDWLVAFLGTGAPLLIRPTGGEALLPGSICVPLILAGLALQIAAKLSLRRSFGVVAANRGVKIGGPYRIVRHPMYAGYIMAQVAFLLTNPSLWNAAIYAFAFSLQIVRIFMEERVLIRDRAYQEFTAAVPYRLAPGIF